MTAVLRAEEPSARYLIRESALAQGFDSLATAAGGIAKLRTLILSLAARGKLSTQRPLDESAELLLAHLQQLKCRRSNSTRGKTEANASDLLANVTGFALPTGWAWASLSDLGTFASGKTPSTGRPDYWDGEIPWVTPKDMKAPRLVDSEDHVSERAIADGLAIVPESAVLIVVRSGILRRMVPVAIAAMRCTVNQDLKALTLFEPLMATYVQLMIGGFEAFILSNLTKIGTTVESIKFDEFASCNFPIPPLAEQHRIVARVEKLMKLCDALEQNGRLADEQHARLTSTLFDALAASESAHALAENWQRVAEHFDLMLHRPEAIDTLEQTILQLAVRGLLVPQVRGDESALDLLARIAAVSTPARGQRAVNAPAGDGTAAATPFELPVGWAWARFADVAHIASNLVHPGQHPDAWQIGPDCIEKGTGRLLSRRTVRESEIISANHSFSAGQILYSKIRPSLSKAAIVDFAGLCSADMYPVEARIASQYLLLVMLSDVFLDQVKEAENRVKMPKLNQEALNGFEVPVPPLAEQHRIVARVEGLRRLCADLRQRLTQARGTQSRVADALVAESVR